MTPWELVKRSEHSHQRAVFAWANCAALYGCAIADHPEAYDLKQREALLSGNPYLHVTPLPELRRLFAIHNQGHGDAIRGAQAKAEGVKAGVPDLFLPLPRLFPERPPLRSMRQAHGLFIELKRPKLKGKAQAGTESDKQADWRDYLTSVGYECHVCVGWLEAVAAIRGYVT